jgi:hypothetical protein
MIGFMFRLVAIVSRSTSRLDVLCEKVCVEQRAGGLIIGQPFLQFGTPEC